MYNYIKLCLLLSWCATHAPPVNIDVANLSTTSPPLLSKNGIIFSFSTSPALVNTPDSLLPIPVHHLCRASSLLADGVYTGPTRFTAYWTR